MSTQPRNPPTHYCFTPAGREALIRLIAQLDFYAALAQVEFSDPRDLAIARSTISAGFAEMAELAGRALAEMLPVDD